ncbi:MAG: hypothetical protein SF097_09500 [Acidobacteriota bacterium]|nr:hypothetical protein [Acidobacteriota bacterium]
MSKPTVAISQKNSDLVQLNSHSKIRLAIKVEISQRRRAWISSKADRWIDELSEPSAPITEQYGYIGRNVTENSKIRFSIKVKVSRCHITRET